MAYVKRISMGNIGEPERTIELEPLEEPASVPVPAPTKEPEPEKVPA